MWNNDPDGDGYGHLTLLILILILLQNMHYNVNEDMNHSSTATRYYVERVLEQWITGTRLMVLDGI